MPRQTRPRERLSVDQLPQRYQRLVTLIRERPGISAMEIAQALGVEETTVLSYISEASKIVPIDSIFQYRNTRYKLASGFTPAQVLALKLTMVLDQLSTPELTALAHAIEATMRSRT